MRRSYAVLVAVVLSGCTTGPGDGTPSASSSIDQPSEHPADDVQGAWVLTAGTVDGRALELVPDHRVTMIIEGSELGGVAACNHYGARALIGPGGLRLDGLGATGMACAAEAMRVEEAYMTALVRVRQLVREGDELVVRGEGVELRFAELDEPPTAELVDTRWHLDGLVSGDDVAAPRGEPAWLEVRSDGTFAGSTGCRSFSGAWIERGDEIMTPTWGMDDRQCPAGLQGQDSHVVTVIGDGFTPSIDADRMILMDVDGTGLTYRAER